MRKLRLKKGRPVGADIIPELVQAGGETMIDVYQDMGNSWMVYPIDSVADCYTPLKEKLTALPEL